MRQNYGLGRVLFVGIDSTWRWRYRTGDLYHHTFWGDTIHWAAADKSLGTGNDFVRFGTSRKDYYGAFTKALEKVADLCKPELVLVSAGFDSHAKDPIGSLGLEVEDFVTLSKQVLDVAKAHAKGRVVSCLEGGYNLEVLAEAVQAHLDELLRNDEKKG